MNADAKSNAPVRRRMSHDARHGQLLDLAEALFVDRGYAAVSMEDIARAADVTRPIVYNHFETKEGVYLACVRRAREQYDAELLTNVTPDLDPLEQVRTGAEQFFSMLERDQGRWLLLFGSNVVLPGDYYRELTDLRFGTIEAIAVLLRESAATGSSPDLLEAGAHALSGVGERLGHWWIAHPEMTKEHVIDLYVEILWNGIKPHVKDHE